MPRALLLASVSFAAAGCGSDDGGAGGDSGAQSGSAQGLERGSSRDGEAAMAGSSDTVVAASDTADVIDATRIVVACGGPTVEPVTQKRAVDTLIRVHDLGPEDRFEYGSGGKALAMEDLLERYAQALDACEQGELASRLRDARRARA